MPCAADPAGDPLSVAEMVPSGPDVRGSPTDHHARAVARRQRPPDLATMIDHMVGRVLDLFNIEQGLNPPWDPPARRGQPRQDEENP